MPKEKKRRSQVKNPALIKKFNSRIRQEYLDYDYLDKLNDEELAWLNKFTEEYLNASPVLTEDNQLDPEANLHKDPKFKKETYDANNRRNADLYGNLRNKTDRFNNYKLVNYDNLIADIEDFMIKGVDPRGLENTYIDFLEKEQLATMMAEYEEAMLKLSAAPLEDR